ncbi:MAG: DUF4400 domain-containing protein, partial [Gammaproteobacteria bacterium]|nr:DUF4400 domain-containing protein [Gammaproteobacteria bacterium]
GIVTLVALGEGILLRDLRRWSGGRESSLRYHLAKKCIKPMLIGVWVVYLSLPVSVHPTWVILPFALAYGVAMTITAASFKKYL